MLVFLECVVADAVRDEGSEDCLQLFPLLSPEE